VGALIRALWSILTLAPLLALIACVDPVTLAPRHGSPAAPVCRVTYVVDGDTVHMNCGGGAMKVRLLGFDTPEVFSPSCRREKAAGDAATRALTALVRSAPVTSAVFHGHDRYGRNLARVAIGGQEVAGYMIGLGLALPYHGHRRPNWCARL